MRTTIDFLNREPDQSGLDFWSGQITACNGNARCVEATRRDVSAAYFLSIEFQQIDYLVYKMNKAAYGNIPGTPVPVRFADFIPDVQTIGSGVVVLSNGWEARLEANKQQFTNAFVARQTFTAKYNGTSNADYVAALNANAGGRLSPTT